MYWVPAKAQAVFEKLPCIFHRRIQCLFQDSPFPKMQSHNSKQILSNSEPFVNYFNLTIISFFTGCHKGRNAFWELCLHQLTDDNLVTAAQTGDKAAYTVLLRKYYQQVFLTCLSVLGSPHDAEDMAQDALITGYTKIRQLRKCVAFLYA
jgi:hypothetical protein